MSVSYIRYATPLHAYATCAYSLYSFGRSLCPLSCLCCLPRICSRSMIFYDLLQLHDMVHSLPSWLYNVSSRLCLYHLFSCSPPSSLYPLFPSREKLPTPVRPFTGPSPCAFRKSFLSFAGAVVPDARRPALSFRSRNYPESPSPVSST